MAQSQFDQSIARIKELTQELESIHWRIVELMAGSNPRVRWAMGDASMVVAWTSKDVQLEDLGATNPRPMVPPSKQLC